MSLLSSGAVTVAGYRVHTGDETTAASAVSAALLEAESLLEEELRRLLDSTERTDDFPIDAQGRIWPNAWPITAASLTIDGRALLGAQPDDSPFIGVFEPRIPNRATVTWTGGFTASTFPTTLAHALYDLARADIVNSPGTSPGNVSSASLGDASVDFDTDTPADGLDSIVAGISGRVGRYRNRFV